MCLPLSYNFIFELVAASHPFAVPGECPCRRCGCTHCAFASSASGSAKARGHRTLAYTWVRVCCPHALAVEPKGDVTSVTVFCETIDTSTFCCLQDDPQDKCIILKGELAVASQPLCQVADALGAVTMAVFTGYGNPV